MSLDRDRLRKIRLLVLDVDGTLTDGRIFFGPRGEEIKAFSATDGLGIKLLQRGGVATVFLTARESVPARVRGKELGVLEVLDGASSKLDSYEGCKRRLGLTDEQVAYMGDDLTDVAPMRRAGVAVTVPHACPEVRAVAAHVTAAPAGLGAVRELAESILRAQGSWDDLVRQVTAE